MHRHRQTARYASNQICKRLDMRLDMQSSQCARHIVDGHKLGYSLNRERYGYLRQHLGAKSVALKAIWWSQYGTAAVESVAVAQYLKCCKVTLAKV